MKVRDVPWSNMGLASDPVVARRLSVDPRALPPAYRTMFIRRDFYGLFIILSGEMAMDVIGSDGKTRFTELAPGRIYLWRPQDLRPLGGTEGDPIEFYDVAVRADAWLGFTSFLGVAPARQTAPAAPIAYYDPDADPDVELAFDTITRAARTGASIVDLAQFLVTIVPRLFPPSSITDEGAPPWLFASVEAMRDEENLRLGMPRFLELARVSPRQLARVTSRYLGITPGEVVAEARIHHAMRLLRVSGDSIALIAEKCGYGTAAYFSNRFRDATGMSPRTFRQRSFHGISGAPR